MFRITFEPKAENQLSNCCRNLSLQTPRGGSINSVETDTQKLQSLLFFPRRSTSLLFYFSTYADFTRFLCEKKGAKCNKPSAQKKENQLQEECALVTMNGSRGGG